MFGRFRTKVYRVCLLGKYPTEPCQSVRYGRNTLLNTPVRFGTNSIPVPDTLASSMRPPKYAPGTGILPTTIIPGVPEFLRYSLDTRVSGIQWRDTDTL